MMKPSDCGGGGKDLVTISISSIPVPMLAELDRQAAEQRRTRSSLILQILRDAVLVAPLSGAVR